MDGVLIDTHIWIWWMNGDSRLSKSALRSLDDAEQRPLLSVISLWEVSLLVQKGLVDLGRTPGAWLNRAAAPETVSLAQITATVAHELFSLPPDFHGDPADRILIATARALDIPLLTHDKAIRRSGLVRLARL